MRKLIIWIKKSGLSNLGYLGGAVLLWIFGHQHFASAFIGIAIYINFNVIKKLITNKLK